METRVIKFRIGFEVPEQFDIVRGIINCYRIGRVETGYDAAHNFEYLAVTVHKNNYDEVRRALSEHGANVIGIPFHHTRQGRQLWRLG